MFFIQIIIMFLILILFYYKNSILYKKKNILIKNIKKLKFLKGKVKNKTSLLKILFNIYNKKFYFPIVNFQNFTLFTNNKKFIYSFIKDINNAIKNIYIIFYIWKPSYLIDKISLSLIDAARRGVSCKIILDSLGSFLFFRTYWPNLMNQEGIEIVEYLNIKKFFINRIDLRQHKKLILIDDSIIYLGSMNLVCNNFYKNIFNKYIDLMVKIKSLMLMEIMKNIFFHDWELETGVDYNINNYLLKMGNNYNYNSCISTIQVINSSPGIPKNIIYNYLCNLILLTKKRLIIITPYFIPDSKLLNILCDLSCKGIKIIILLPKINDSFLVFWANRFFFETLLSFKIKIYLYQKEFLHTKMILIDENISLIGSMNFDFRSIWLNFEIALIIEDKLLNKKLFKVYKKYISESKLINLDVWKKRTLYKKIIENFIILGKVFL